MKKLISSLFLLAIMAICNGNIAQAEIYNVAGKELHILGQISQTVNYGFKDTYDYEKGINTVLTDVLLDAGLILNDELRLNTLLGLSADWIYELKSGDDSWKSKGFSESRDEMYFDDEYWQVLKELHVTWAPGDFLFRVGKQVVTWGLIDGPNILNQINPEDGRRGETETEFETSVIPIWMMRAEYNPGIYSDFINDLNIQFLFNPNADFIPSQQLEPGPDTNGIFSPAVGQGFGSFDKTEIKPDEWDSEGYEYGVQIQAFIRGSIVNLNYFNGTANEYVSELNMEAAGENIGNNLAAGLGPDPFRYDSLGLGHLPIAVHWPDQEFFGGYISHDIQSWTFMPGKSTPILKFECAYELDKVFEVNSDYVLEEGAPSFLEKDVFTWGVGIEWNIDIPYITARGNGLIFNSSYISSRILDYDHRLNGPQDDTFLIFGISTLYMSARLKPDFTLVRDMEAEEELYTLSAEYLYSDSINISGGVKIYDGPSIVEDSASLGLFQNKNHVFFKIIYQWG